MNLLREYIRELLKEDPMGFVHDLAAAHDEFGEEGQPFFGGDPGKGGGKAIKRAFAKNADHKWLSTLNTVHWGDVYALEDLIGKNKDELSTLMSLPGENFEVSGKNTGLWVKGRITLAGNDMDKFHLKITLKSKKLKSLNKVEANKIIYKSISDELKTHIHSIQLSINQ